MLYRSFYTCPTCANVEWDEVWDATCNSECPLCGLSDIEPLSWEDVDDEEEEGY